MRTTPYKIDASKVKISPFMKGSKNVDEAVKKVKQSLKMKKIPFSQESSLKSMGLLKRSDGSFKLGDKYIKQLPKLKPAMKENKKYHYKLSDPFKLRKLALDEGIKSGAKKYGSIRESASRKKGRLNILRIYRRYKNPEHCNQITYDMKYIDKTYLKDGKTKNICS